MQLLWTLCCLLSIVYYISLLYKVERNVLVRAGAATYQLDCQSMLLTAGHSVKAALFSLKDQPLMKELNIQHIFYQ
jgi:hypothetical protein